MCWCAGLDASGTSGALSTGLESERQTNAPRLIVLDVKMLGISIWVQLGASSKDIGNDSCSMQTCVYALTKCASLVQSQRTCFCHLYYTTAVPSAAACGLGADRHDDAAAVQVCFRHRWRGIWGLMLMALLALEMQRLALLATSFDLLPSCASDTCLPQLLGSTV